MSFGNSSVNGRSTTISSMKRMSIWWRERGKKGSGNRWANWRKERKKEEGKRRNERRSHGYVAVGHAVARWRAWGYRKSSDRSGAGEPDPPPPPPLLLPPSFPSRQHWEKEKKWKEKPRRGSDVAPRGSFTWLQQEKRWCTPPSIT